jgi:hypothetical protein
VFVLWIFVHSYDYGKHRKEVEKAVFAYEFAGEHHQFAFSMNWSIVGLESLFS